MRLSFLVLTCTLVGCAPRFQVDPCDTRVADLKARWGKPYTEREDSDGYRYISFKFNGSPTTIYGYQLRNMGTYCRETSSTTRV